MYPCICSLILFFFIFKASKSSKSSESTQILSNTSSNFFATVPFPQPQMPLAPNLPPIPNNVCDILNTEDSVSTPSAPQVTVVIASNQDNNTSTKQQHPAIATTSSTSKKKKQNNAKKQKKKSVVSASTTKKKKKKSRAKHTFVPLSQMNPISIDGIDRKGYNSLSLSTTNPKDVSKSTLSLNEQAALSATKGTTSEAVASSTVSSDNTTSTTLSQASDLLKQCRALQDSICNSISNNMKWCGKLCFDLFSDDGYKNENMDVFTYSQNSQFKSNALKLYFDPQQYLCTDGFKSPSWDDLKSFIIKEAGRQGFKLAIASGEDKRKGRVKAKQFRCQKGFVYKGDLVNRWSKEYRKFSTSNDALNSRGEDGIHDPRRSSCARTITKCEKCPFNFQVAHDTVGFYIIPGSGSNIHTDHLVVHSNTAFIPDRCIVVPKDSVAQKVADAGVSSDIVGAVLHSDTQETMNRQAIHYHTNKNRKKKGSDGRPQNSKDETDQIFELLEENEIPYIALASNSVCDAESLNLVYNAHNSDITGAYGSDNQDHNYTTPPSADGIDDAKNYIKTKWNILGLNDLQQLMVAFAYTTPLQQRMFEIHPEVICIDTTQETNNEDRPLLTISGMDNNGKMFPILKAFLPHERGWIFHWIMCVVMPKLFSKEAIEGVKLIISDGDAQEIAAIDEAIDKFFINAIRQRCGWHIIDKGWERRGPKSPGENDDVAFKEFAEQKQILRKWLYSWCKPQVETEGEFKISFFILMKYIGSEELKDRLGEQFVSEISTFIRDYMQPSHTHMVFHRRKGRRHFHLYSNTIHEGTNKKIKYGAHKCTPSTSLLKATQNLLKSDRLWEDQTLKRIANELDKTVTWSPLPFANDLCTRGFRSLKNEWDYSESYTPKRVSQEDWKVAMNRDKVEERCKAVHPVFDRTRTVTFKKGVFYCSCTLFEERGYGCRHIWSVLRSFPLYTYPTKHDCSCVHWRQYSFFMLFRHESTKEITLMFERLRRNDAKGPSCDPLLFQDIEIVDIQDLPNEFKIRGSVCLNYKLDKVLSRELGAVEDPVGLSQIERTVYDDLESSVTGNGSCIVDVTMEESSHEDEQDTSNLDSQFQSNIELMSQDITTPQKIDAFQSLKPALKEVASYLESVRDPDQVARADTLIRNVTSILSEEFKHKLPKSKDTDGKMVSSNHVTRSTRKKGRTARSMVYGKGS